MPGLRKPASSFSNGTIFPARRRCRLDGRVPDLFMVSSMGLHSGAVHGTDPGCPADRPGQRPLIIAGGPHAVYQPYELFGTIRPIPTAPMWW